jgi:hypothetical protein
MRLSRGSVLQNFYLLKGITFFMIKKNKNIEYLNNELWVSDILFLVDVTAYLNSLDTEFKSKGKLLTEMSDNVKAFKVKLRLWKNQLKVQNFFHVLQLKLLNTFFPGA